MPDIREMAPEKDEIVTYWLVPAEPARSYFDSLIRNLAARYDAPVFEPHMTIYTTGRSDKNAADLLQRVLTASGVYRLRVRDIDCSDEFTKTLFVQFEPNEDVTQLTHDLQRASALKHEYEFNPHLSLIYKTLPRETKVDIANSVNLPFNEVQFDAAKAVISPSDIQSREDVEGWRVVATEKLTA